MNKKIFTFAFGTMLLLALVSATVVPYISNIISGDISVESPITITVDGQEFYSLSLYAGESVSVESLTEVHIDGVTGHIAEIRIPDFDGEGISLEYRVDTYPGIFQLPVCVIGDDAYFYIGDPSETLDAGSFYSTTIFNTALDLDTHRDYIVETGVILAENAMCDSIPAPVFVAD